jgi:hypothetical protein
MQNGWIYEKNWRLSFFLKVYFPKYLGFVFFVTALLYVTDTRAANVTLAWEQSPDPVTGYKIFYGEQSVLTNPASDIGVGNVLIYTITNLTAGHTYYFALKAYYYNNESGFSSELTYTVPASGFPTTTTTPTTTPTTTTTIAETITINPTSASHNALGGNGFINIVASDNTTSWTAKSNIAWVAIKTDTSGAGNEVLVYAVSANNGVARSGTLTIANKTFTIHQAGLTTTQPTTTTTVLTGCIDTDVDGYSVGPKCVREQDCDDNDSDVNPGAEEICGDGIDNNCNKLIDEDCDGKECPFVNLLGDGYPNLANLRSFRDKTLIKNTIGRKIVAIYYNNVDSVNAALDRSPFLRAVTRRVLEVIAPMVGKN